MTRKTSFRFPNTGRKLPSGQRGCGWNQCWSVQPIDKCIMYACKLRRPKTEDSTQGRYARCETCFVSPPKWVPVPRYYCKPTRAGVESPKEFTPPMQFRRFKDNSEAVRRDRVRQLFEVRYDEERTETGVLLFYAWLEKYDRELLPQQKRGDPYQYLKVDLEGLYE